MSECADNNGDGKCDTCGTALTASEGLEFTLNEDGKSYSVTGIGTCTDTDVVIPGTYNGLPVTAIGNEAFLFCYALTSVVIPEGVTSIEDSAFYYCSSLESITISSSVCSVGDKVFDFCGLRSITVVAGNKTYHSAGNCLIETASKTLILGSSTSVIPTDGSVTSIDNRAFYKCAGLTSIIIPNTVTSIGEEAFAECDRLTSITIPGSVRSMGLLAFWESGLESVTILNGVTAIDGRTFSYCRRLTSITIADSVTSIGANAFEGCENLTNITIPSSVTSIGASAFVYCHNLTNITIPSSVTSIGDHLFRGCDNLTNITFTGTMAQWDAVEKGREWYPSDYFKAIDYTIHCTDGDITG